MKFIIIYSIFFLHSIRGDKYDEENYAVIYASRCEACKYVIEEFGLLMEETGKTSKVIETGYKLEGKKKKTKYVDSRMRFDDIMDSICERMNEYKVHKERKDSTRFEKKISQTFEALEGLVNRGVKVELGIPHELWNKSSAEIADLEKKCDAMTEEHENQLLLWYTNKNNEREIPLKKFFCEDYYLKRKNDNPSCLYEVFDKEKSLKTKEELKKEKEEVRRKKEAAARKEDL